MAPESVGEVLRLAQELRLIGKQHPEAPPEERFGTDKLQGLATMLHAVSQSLELVHPSSL